jgi:hypothetical protein
VTHALVLALVLALALVCVALAFGAGYGLAVARLRTLQPPPAASTEIVATHVEPARVVFARLVPEGTPEWRAAMQALGARMKNARTRLVVFVHGSFVGDDPLAIARTLEGAVPVLPDLARALRGFTRAQVSRLLGDLSNFPRDYVDALAEATGIEAVDFTWSGENHHAARVQETVRLARVLALHGGGALGPDDRVLLIGHSHGGQLFALLSQLVARARGYDELVGAAAARGEDVGVLEDHLERLRRCAFDVATFGTPPRYTFASTSKFRLLHVINHRKTTARAASLRGLLHTRRGDYVHHLGAPGSDWPALSAKDRALNQRLDGILGAGTDLRAWLRHVARGLRVSPHGHTLLVDYGDEARIVPNFWATGFGHAAYTRRDAMLFHMQLVADHFYPAGDGREDVRRPSPARLWTGRARRLLPGRRSRSAPTTGR